MTILCNNIRPQDLQAKVEQNFNPNSEGIPQRSTMVEVKAAFADLIRECLNLDYKRRIKPADALRHRFFELAVPMTLRKYSFVDIFSSVNLKKYCLSCLRYICKKQD